MKILKTIGLLLLISVAAFSQSDFETGVAAFNKRAEGATGLKAPAANIDKAIASLTKALANATVEEKATVLLMRSYYFKGTFVETEKEARKAVYDLSKLLGEKQVVKFPKSASVHYWYLANMAKWGETSGILKAAKEGLADLLYTLCNKVIELDPAYSYGAGYRMLGIIHFKTPYIPFLISWPDNDDAIENLEKSLEYKSDHLMGQLYLAQVYHDKGRKDEAIKTWEKVAAGTANPEYLLEEGKDIKEAKEFLAKYKKKKK
ncbi:TPA: hypothetical protein EYN23_03970 [Candidatus Poribacteria bacterium]|nr:hypothetical protein [Candidatus Poribacteria bacterium]